MASPPKVGRSGLNADTFYQKNKSDKSFTEKLDADALAFFNNTTKLPFSQQAVAFLNAYWAEIKSEAEFIYSMAWSTICYADMHNKGIQLVYKYDEGHDLDFDIALFFYEQLCKKCEEPKQAAVVAKYKPSLPVMMTAIKRKQELRDEVDVNFDGRVSFLEYLLYQYKTVANPADFCKRSMTHEEHPEIKKARLALDEVNKRIRAYEEEKARLEKESQGEGVKALGAKNLLAQLESSPIKEELNKALITAEAAVRLASKKFGSASMQTLTPSPATTGAAASLAAKEAAASGSSSPTPVKQTVVGGSEGAIWWMNRDLKDKQEKYGPKKK